MTTPETDGPDDAEAFRRELGEALAEIGRLRMPFGKYGPEKFPPAGVPIYDLPVEYLLWFRQKGFPRGRLGELLEMVLQIKLDGAEAVFEPFRNAAGGRHPLRPERRKTWDFGTGD
jgi:uncharacterized protein (DUF3820 family)